MISCAAEGREQRGKQKLIQQDRQCQKKNNCRQNTRQKTKDWDGQTPGIDLMYSGRESTSCNAGGTNRDKSWQRKWGRNCYYDKRNISTNPLLSVTCKVSCSCSTNGIRRVTLVTNPGEKSWMRKGPDCNYDKRNLSSHLWHTYSTMVATVKLSKWCDQHSNYDSLVE
jgi:hypothetical protein